MNKQLTALLTACAMTAGIGIMPVMAASASDTLKTELIDLFDAAAENGEVEVDGIVFIKDDNETDDNILDDVITTKNKVSVSTTSKSQTITSTNATLTAKVDMDKVKDAYNACINLAELTLLDGTLTEDMINGVNVEGSFEITLTLPSAVKANKDKLKFTVNDSEDDFEAIYGEPTVDGNKITFSVNKNKLVLDDYFDGNPDITITCPVTVSSIGTFKITGSMTGYTDIKSSGNTPEVQDIAHIEYESNFSTTITRRTTGTSGVTSPSGSQPSTSVTPTPTPYVEPTLNPNPDITAAPADQQVDVELDKNNTFKYIYGYPEGNVRPEANITRAEVAAIFYRLLTEESRAKHAEDATNIFSDVNEEDWFCEAVSVMNAAGVIKGYEDGTFKPNNSITRAEFAKIAAAFSNAIYAGTDNKFTDINGHWAAGHINVAAEIGWITGYSDNTFKPDNKITRSEAITLINRVIERNAIVISKYEITWPDNTTDKWYYEAVQKATNDISVN